MEDRVYTFENDFRACVAAMESGDVLQIDAELFYYFLEVLPPVRAAHPTIEREPQGYGGTWTRRDGTKQRFAFAFAEGADPITLFWMTGSGEAVRYFCQRTGIINRS